MAIGESGVGMFFRQVDDDIKLSLTIPQYADELFALTDRNRDYLCEWLPWPDAVRQPSDTREFIDENLLRFQRGQGLNATVFYRDAIAGVVDFHAINPVTRTAQIGYWLGQEYHGKGIMTASVRELIVIGFDCLGLNRIEIQAVTENHRSIAIPMRLGFTHEGTRRQALCLKDRYWDLAVYGLLKQEWQMGRQSGGGCLEKSGR